MTSSTRSALAPYATASEEDLAAGRRALMGGG